MEPTIVAYDDTIYTTVNLEILRLGPNADLNHIDVSNVTDMEGLFRRSPFNGNISKWDVSRVKNIAYMFYCSQFQGDISPWKIYSPDYTAAAFEESKCKSAISEWLFKHDVAYIGLSNQLFPRVETHDVESYKYALRRMYNEQSIRTVLTRILPFLSNTTTPGYHHAVAMILYPNTKVSRIHRQLTLEDQQAVQVLFNTTESVHQAATIWNQMRLQPSQHSQTYNPDLSEVFN
jgi:hypothetical protein